MLVIFRYTKQECLQAVKRESSYIAKRTNENDFDTLVFDEDYTDLFDSLFADARSRVASSLACYIIPWDDSKKTQAGMSDYDFETNCGLCLRVPETFRTELVESIFFEIRSYMTAYLLYRWFEMKVPDMAVTFLNRSETHKANYRRLAEMRTERRKIKGY